MIPVQQRKGSAVQLFNFFHTFSNEYCYRKYPPTQHVNQIWKRKRKKIDNVSSETVLHTFKYTRVQVYNSNNEMKGCIKLLKMLNYVENVVN